MTQEERQRKFELFVEGFGMPLEVKLIPYSKTRILLNILGGFFLWLFDESNLNGIGLIGIIIAIILFIVYSFSKIVFFLLLILISCGLVYYIISLYRYVFLPLSKDRIVIKIDTNGITVHKAFYGWNEITHMHASSSHFFFCTSQYSQSILIKQHRLIPHNGGINYCLEKYRELYNIKKNTFNL
ncbi:MAG: hypothetical protein MUC49_07785 [Raineya sp.]|nr:hypothetical protein [Raineya sp.]